MRAILKISIPLLAMLAILPTPAEAAKSDCISRGEVLKIVKEGPTRERVIEITGWEGEREGRRFSAYRKCGHSWEEKTIVLGYVGKRVWFVTTISDGGAQ